MVRKHDGEAWPPNLPIKEFVAMAYDDLSDEMIDAGVHALKINLDLSDDLLDTLEDECNLHMVAKDVWLAMREAEVRGCPACGEPLNERSRRIQGKLQRIADNAIAAGSRRAKTAKRVECEASQSGGKAASPKLSS